MDAATTSQTTPEGTEDVARRGGNDPLITSPKSTPFSILSKPRASKFGAVGSPVRRSPRLSRSLPPQPPVECQDASTDDDSESINDVALHLSRDETPENDALLPDEPSTVLASKILRASDNPSPPPPDAGVSYVHGKGDRSPSHDVSPPPSSPRPIDLSKRTNQVSSPSFDSLRGLSTPTSGNGRVHLQPGIIAPENCLQPFGSATVESSLYKGLDPAGAFPSSATRCAAVDPPPQQSCEPASSTADTLSSQSVIDMRGKQMTTPERLDFETSRSSPTQVVSPPLDLDIPPTLNIYSQEALSSLVQQDHTKSNSAILASLQSSEDEKTLPAAHTVDSNENDEKESTLISDSLSLSRGQQENKPGDGGNKSLHDSLHFQSSNAFSTEKTDLSTEPFSIRQLQTPQPSGTHPTLSGSTVQRPAVHTPARAGNSTRKSLSPTKFSEVNDPCRTPAQRIPIETALARGVTSLQKTIRLSSRLDQSQVDQLPMIRSLVFTRPALDDPSRSPAKRIPVADWTISPARAQIQNSPMRSSIRVRSASVEPLPLGHILARSRSAEPCLVIPKPEVRERPSESIFPIVPMPPRPGTRLPFPLVPVEKLNNDLTPSIPEENETAEERDPGTHATQSNVMSGALSQLRQPPTSSRIPRIGNKPYGKPPSKNGRATLGTTIRDRALKASPFQLAYKNHATGNGDADVPSTQPVNDQRLAGSLKRKRGVETGAPPNPHVIMIRQVVPGILGEKYTAKAPSQGQTTSELSPQKATQPLKFRKVVDGMLSARYPPAKVNLAQTEQSDPAAPPSPLSEISTSSNEEPSGESHSCVPSENVASESSRPSDTVLAEPVLNDHTSSHQSVDGTNLSNRPRRTSRTRKPAQQQYVLDVFSTNTSAVRPAPVGRKPRTRAEGDSFMGMSATALKALTTSNTTKNQQTVAVLATEVIRKEGLRPESPTVKARTILQKQRDERDVRRRERAQKKAQMSEESLRAHDSEGSGDRILVGEHDENDYGSTQKHCRGPGEEEDYETPERPDRNIESPSLEGANGKAKQVKWHRGLSTAVYLDDIDPKPKPPPKSVDVRGCLAPTSKNLPLDSLGNLIDIDNQPTPELVAEQIIVKRYLYDNDVEPEPIPIKVTRSKSKKNKS